MTNLIPPAHDQTPLLLRPERRGERAAVQKGVPELFRGIARSSEALTLTYGRSHLGWEREPSGFRMDMGMASALVTVEYP